MSDILFKTDDYIFSYRVGGLLIRDGKVLMQKSDVDDEIPPTSIVREFIGGNSFYK